MEKLIKKESNSCLDCIFCIKSIEAGVLCKRGFKKESDCDGFVYLLEEEKKKRRRKGEKT